MTSAVSSEAVFGTSHVGFTKVVAMVSRPVGSKVFRVFKTP